MILYTSGALAGELSAKAVAQSFWHREVEEELQASGLREKWTFSSERSAELTGTNDHAMEVIDKNRCDNLYLHNCSTNCKSKGRLPIIQIILLVWYTVKCTVCAIRNVTSQTEQSHL